MQPTISRQLKVISRRWTQLRGWSAPPVSAASIPATLPATPTPSRHPAEGARAMPGVGDGASGHSVRPMRFGFKTAPQDTAWDDMLAVWQAADEIELFESAWTFDHFYPIFSDPTGPCLEGWITLTALAQATRRLRVGVMVTGNVYRHPAVLANMAATVDIVSGGRLELGLGAGWNQEECDAYGIELPPLKERFDRFDEAVEVIVGLLSQETTTLDGRHYRLRDARCEPKPVQQPHPPICIGG